MSGFVFNVFCAGLLVVAVYGAAVPAKPKYNSEKSLSSAQKVELLKEQLEELQKNLYKLSDTFSSEQEEEKASETVPTKAPEKKPTTNPPTDPSEELEAKNFVDSVAASLEKPRERGRGSGNELTQEDVDFLQELKSFFKKKATQMVQETKEETDDELKKESQPSEKKAATRTHSAKKEAQQKNEDALADRLQADLREASREGITLEALLKQMKEDTARLNEESRRQALQLQGKREPREQSGEENLIALAEGQLAM
ncbi:PREDICTED: uncharacterized protein LOC109468938 [Branchiostoma belcheri]|uniref:Uncharacterized protein LOC109468938 n=1 Tax=Branchiostoma belcheri TaxID=7741 RepID=A0A6P4YVW2_BRABE|nr:PREDICTED: uncharacterized protein LOC109468938 [Branchiostoma belcheri]